MWISRSVIRDYTVRKRSNKAITELECGEQDDRHVARESNDVSFSVGAFEIKADAWPREVGLQAAIDRG